jgi:hypothetical protein
MSAQRDLVYTYNYWSLFARLWKPEVLYGSSIVFCHNASYAATEFVVGTTSPSFRIQRDDSNARPALSARR